MITFKDELERTHPYLKGKDYYNSTKNTLLPKLLLSPYEVDSSHDQEWLMGFQDAMFLDKVIGEKK